MTSQLTGLGFYMLPWILASVHGEAETGELAACTTLVGLSNLFVMGLNNYLMPKAARAFAVQGARDFRRVLRTATFCAAVVLGALCVGVFFVGNDLAGMMFGTEYADTGPLLTVLALAAMTDALGLIAGTGLWAMDRPATSIVGDAAQLVVTLAVALWLVFPYGAMGIAAGDGGRPIVRRRSALAHHLDAVGFLTLRANDGVQYDAFRWVMIAMNEGTIQLADASTANRRLLWLAIAVVGAVYFFVAHNVQVSRYEGFAPWSDTEGTLESGRNALKGAALGLIGLLGAYCALRRDGRPLELTGWLPVLMILYLAWAMASVLWSEDWGMSCRRLAVLMFCVVGAVGFARQLRPRDVAVMALVISGAYLLVGVAAEVALGTFHPGWPGYRFAGTVHPNTQGAHLAVLCLASFCLARAATRGRVWLWGLFAVGLVFLLLTKSRTSCAGPGMRLGGIVVAERFSTHANANGSGCGVRRLFGRAGGDDVRRRSRRQTG